MLRSRGERLLLHSFFFFLKAESRCCGRVKTWLRIYNVHTSFTPVWKEGKQHAAGQKIIKRCFDKGYTYVIHYFPLWLMFTTFPLHKYCFSVVWLNSTVTKERWSQTLEGKPPFNCNVFQYFKIMSKKWWEPASIHSCSLIFMNNCLGWILAIPLTFIFLPWLFPKCLLAYRLNNTSETGCSAISIDSACLKRPR